MSQGDSWFQLCKTLEEGRTRYRELLMEWHPDRNKSPSAEGTFKSIQEDFQKWLRTRTTSDFIKDMHKREGAAARAAVVHPPEFYTALARVMAMNVDVEVVGGWIHVTNASSRDLLALIQGGFWWSVAHKAHIWSPDGKKRGVAATGISTEALKARWGTERKRDKRYMG